MEIDVSNLTSKIIQSKKRAVAEKKKARDSKMSFPKQVGGVKVGKWNPKKVNFNLPSTNKGNFAKRSAVAKKELKRKFK